MKYIIERNDNYLMHRSHKYIDKHKSGNWIYVYDKSKASSNRNIIKKDKTYNNDVPDEYQPKMEKEQSYKGRAKQKINNFLGSTFSEDTAEKTRNAVEKVINNVKDKELKN